MRALVDDAATVQHHDAVGAQHGGQAVEVVTGSHTAADFQKYADMALEFGLLASRGSDFHSPGESRTDLGARPEQVRKVIEAHAESFEQPAEMVRWFYGQPERMAEGEAIGMEDNVVEWSLGKMQVEDTATPFEELMGTKKA